MKLLFSGSRDGFGTSVFHEKCDNIQDTLTILRTEFGRTIASYNH
jgi:hypothetical protein